MTSTRTKVMTEDEPGVTTRPLVTRATILTPYLERLGIGEDADESPEEPPTNVDAGNYVLELDEWERTVIRSYSSGTDAKGRPWPSLVTEGLAFQLRCIERASVLDGAEVDTPRPVCPPDRPSDHRRCHRNHAARRTAVGDQPLDSRRPGACRRSTRGVPQRRESERLART